MNRQIIKQFSVEQIENSLILKALILTEFKNILTSRFAKQLSELQALGCSECEANSLKHIHKMQIQKIDNDIVETENELKSLKES